MTYGKTYMNVKLEREEWLQSGRLLESWLVQDGADLATEDGGYWRVHTVGLKPQESYFNTWLHEMFSDRKQTLN